MSGNLCDRLSQFKSENKFHGKGALSLALYLTEVARLRKFPIDHTTLVAASGGQVVGLSSGPVQKILLRHGIGRRLATEGGRTSRGSIANMRAYIELLNGLEISGDLDLNVIETFWVEQVQLFFAAKPLKLNLDRSNHLRFAVRGVLSQALGRQKESTGTNYVGAVMQHLVGAKLDCVFPDAKLGHNSFSTADEPTGRSGDFLIGETVIHVTNSPTAQLVSKCKANLQNGLRPIIITSTRGAAAAELFAENESLNERIEVLEIEQFLALNFYEIGKFH